MIVGFWGDTFLDSWEQVAVSINPEANTPTYYLTNSKEYYPGGAANTARQLRHFANCVLFSSIDEAIRSKLRLSRTDLTNCNSIPAVPHKRRLVDASGHILARVDDEFRMPAITPVLMNDLDAIVISDYHRGTISEVSVAEVANEMSGKPIVWDCKRKPNCVPKGVIIKANSADSRDWPELVDVVTRGAEAPLVGGKPIAVTPVPIRCPFNASGAGDAFSAFLAYGLAQGHNLADAVSYAYIAAAVAGSGRYMRTPALPFEIETAYKPRLRKQLLFDDFFDWLRYRANGKIAVTCGCFDILHAGHLKLLQRCRELADHVIVLINSDEYICKTKGHNRPINCEADRITALTYLDTVDQVQVFRTSTPVEFMRWIRDCRTIDFFVKGDDLVDRGGIDLAEQLELVPIYGKHTSDIIRQFSI